MSFDAIEALSYGMSAARMRVNVLASNIANAEVTRTPEGGPYKRRDVVQIARDVPASFGNALDKATLSVPQVAAVVEDGSPARKVYQPGHPDADAQGYVAFPNINVVTTMTDLMSATRLYQANVTAIENARRMSSDAQRILQSA